MITVKFFASVREATGVDEINIDAKRAPYSVAALINDITKLNPDWENTLTASRVLVAVNHNISSIAAVVNAGDEVAFFPPMTGG